MFQIWRQNHRPCTLPYLTPKQLVFDFIKLIELKKSYERNNVPDLYVHITNYIFAILFNL